MSGSTTARSTLDLTVEIVSAHIANNALPADALPALIQSVYRTLTTIATGSAVAKTAADKPQPAVPPKRSVFADYIVCLEDGKRLKMLKRHLSASYNLTPEQYRERWGLPSDYPMVAPSYATTRSSLAKSIGLGRNKSTRAKEPAREPTIIHGPARRARGSRG